MSPELVSGIARVAHEKLLSVLTECGTKKTKGTCLFASYLVCYLAKTKGLDAVVRGGNGADDGEVVLRPFIVNPDELMLTPADVVEFNSQVINVDRQRHPEWFR
ncbi:hypothetical protein QU862_29420 [Escherichia coli]|nr:hypothetical protein [Escherichia coli]